MYSIVKENFKDTDASGVGSLATDAWGSAVSAGNAIVVFVFYYAASARTVTLTDGVNDAKFAQAGSGLFASGFDLGMRIFVAPNVISTSNAITATFNNSTTTPALYAAEVSGIALTSPVAGQAFQRQDNPSNDPDLISSGVTGTLSGQPAALISVSLDHQKAITANLGAGTGFTALSPIWNFNTAQAFGRAEHKRLTATTAVAGTFTAASSGDGTQSFITGAVALLESASGPGVNRLTREAGSGGMGPAMSGGMRGRGRIVVPHPVVFLPPGLTRALRDVRP